MGRLIVGAVLAILLVGCWGRARPTFEYEAPVTTTSAATAPEPMEPSAAESPRPADATTADTSPPPAPVPRAPEWRRAGKW